MIKTSNKIILSIIFILLAAASANAFTTTDGTKIFGFAVTSGNNQMNSPNYGSAVVVGGITGAVSSSNFKTQLGFLGTTIGADDDPCQLDVECVGQFCCRGKCSHLHCPTAQAPAPAGESGGGSANPPAETQIPPNSYIYFFETVKANDEVSVDINRNELPLTKIIFTLKESLNDVLLSLSPIDSPSAAIEDAIQYFEISSNKINSNNIASFIIRFKVRRDLGYIKETVALNKYENVWIKLPTSLIGEDKDYYYYESTTIGFSLYAITGKKYAAANVTQQPKQPEELVPPVKTIPPPEKEIQVPQPPVQEANVSKALQAVPPGAAEAKKEPPYGKILLQFGIPAGVLAMLSFFIYLFPKLQFRHIKKIYGTFNKSLTEITFDLRTNKIYEATKVYHQLLQSYTELMKYPLKRELKMHMYMKTKHIYEELARMRNGGTRI